LAQRVPITVHLESFEGPLDLLLYLIQSHELDISRVSIGRITDQYLAYVTLMQELNFDAASEFLVLAATLLHWKSRSLLPQDNATNGVNPEDQQEALSQEELIRQLLEHQRFLTAGQNLAQLPLLGLDVYCRANQKPPIEKIWREMNITDLTLTYQDLLVRARKRTQILRKETVSVKDKIKEFAARLPIHELIEFKQLLSAIESRTEVVATFLTLLELARLKKARLFQEATYAALYMEILEALDEFDYSFASEFDLKKVEENLPAPETPLLA
jgi:segregation and condensation protein A